MKLFVRRFILLSFVWMALGSLTTAKESAKPVTRATSYYWFYYAGDSYFEYASVAQAEIDLDNLTGYTCNTVVNANQIADAYGDVYQPHDLPVSVRLYGH